VGRIARLFYSLKFYMNIVEKVTATIEPSLSALGYALVQIKLAEGARHKTLTVMAERADGQGMSFDDCTLISQTAGALLEVDDPITGAYDLEVCSPGVDRPLTRRDDFSRFAGQEAKIETMIPIDGRRRFRGIIERMENETITLKMPEGEVKIEFRNIRNAKLMASEALAGKLKKKKNGG
jgi:ribosome maturation factor RimP